MKLNNVRAILDLAAWMDKHQARIEGENLRIFVGEDSRYLFNPKTGQDLRNHLPKTEAGLTGLFADEFRAKYRAAENEIRDDHEPGRRKLAEVFKEFLRTASPHLSYTPNEPACIGDFNLDGIAEAHKWLDQFMEEYRRGDSVPALADPVNPVLSAPGKATERTNHGAPISLDGKPWVVRPLKEILADTEQAALDLYAEEFRKNYREFRWALAPDDRAALSGAFQDLLSEIDLSKTVNGEPASRITDLTWDGLREVHAWLNDCIKKHEASRPDPADTPPAPPAPPAPPVRNPATRRMPGYPSEPYNILAVTMIRPDLEEAFIEEWIAHHLKVCRKLIIGLDTTATDTELGQQAPGAAWPALPGSGATHPKELRRLADSMLGRWTFGKTARLLDLATGAPRVSWHPLHHVKVEFSTNLGQRQGQWMNFVLGSDTAKFFATRGVTHATFLDCDEFLVVDSPPGRGNPLWDARGFTFGQTVYPPRIPGQNLAQWEAQGPLGYMPYNPKSMVRIGLGVPNPAWYALTQWNGPHFPRFLEPHPANPDAPCWFAHFRGNRNVYRPDGSLYGPDYEGILASQSHNFTTP